MSGKRIEIVEPCVHGSDGAHMAEGYSWCSEASRRTLVEGQYVLIEKVDGAWPEWTHADWRVDEKLDALSNHTEGTP